MDLDAPPITEEEKIVPPTEETQVTASYDDEAQESEDSYEDDFIELMQAAAQASADADQEER